VPRTSNPADDRDVAAAGRLGAGTVGRVANVDSGLGRATARVRRAPQRPRPGMKVLGTSTPATRSPSTAASAAATRRGLEHAGVARAARPTSTSVRVLRPDLDGIFFDEAPDQCGTTLAPTSMQTATRPRRLCEAGAPRSAHRTQPGQAVPRCFETRGRLVTFEASYGDYTAAASRRTRLQPLTWTPRTPEDLAHRLRRDRPDRWSR